MGMPTVSVRLLARMLWYCFLEVELQKISFVRRRLIVRCTEIDRKQTWGSAMTKSEAVEFRVDGSIAYLTLNRPEAGNAVNEEMVKSLAHYALVCDNDPNLKVVLLSAKGKCFCVGGDLRMFRALGDRTNIALKHLADDLHKAVSIFSRMDPVLVVAVNGIAAGGGFSLSLVGDYVIAAESANFSMAYTATGLSPDGSSTYFLPRIVGLRRAQELTFANRRLSAHEAVSWGLISRAVPDEKLQEEAIAFCAKLAAGSWRSQAIVKRLFLESLRNGLEEQMELEGREIARSAALPDGKEGIAAFVGKRAPKFLS
jgi:2-(1,2-epoxy-1,2-dihydrophenyl)acetyl-CoA isomerase